MATIIETKKDTSGRAVRLQARRGSFDVIRCDGFCWRYVEKSVSEQRARNTFALLIL